MRLSFFLILFSYAVGLNAQWQRLQGPTPLLYGGEAGNVIAIATNDTFVWIGTENSGVFRADGTFQGEWKAKNTGINTYTIFSLVYASGRLAVTTDRGIYISTNNGDSWTAINNGLPIGQKITSFTATPTALFAATERFGIFRSTNNGQSWLAANNGLLDNNIAQVKADAASVWALTVNAGIFKSVDDGQNWQAVSLPGSCLQCKEIAITDSNIFIAQGNLLTSANGGKTWSIDNSLKNVIGITAYKGRLIAHSAYRVYESYDTGKKWTLDFEFNVDSNFRINTAQSSPSEIKYIATQKHGIARGSIAAITWKPYNNNLLTADCRQLQWHNGKLYTVAFGQLFQSNNRGISWDQAGLFAGVGANSFVLLGNKIMVSTDTGGIWVADNQLLWQQTNSGLGNKNVNKVIKRGSDVYALTKNGIYRSPNEGQLWFKYANAIDTLLFTDMLFDGGTLYVGTNLGLFKSTNGGANFSKVDTSNIPRRFVHFIRKVNGQLWLKVGIDTHVSNDGISWPRYYYVGGVTFANSASVVKNRWYASTTSGFLFKDTAAPQWNYLKSIDGLPANVFEVNDSFLYAGTTAGVWRLPLTSVVASLPTTENERLVIFPNPAQSWITVQAEDIISIEVYTTDGKKMECPQSSNRLNLQNLPTGLYVVKAVTNNGIITQKVIKE